MTEVIDMSKKVVGILLQSDSGRLFTERVPQNHPVAKPLITNTKEFVRNLFLAWKKLHQQKKAQKLSHKVIGALFYEAMYELFDPKHRNAFLEMLKREEEAETERINLKPEDGNILKQLDQILPSDA